MARALIAALTALSLASTAALSQSAGPAVSDPNAKLSVEGGQYDGEQSALALGSYTLPLGHAFGLQADGALGRIDQGTMGGGGLHLFTRDPSRYLLGLYGSYHTWESIDIWRAAAEVQLYAGRFSLDGLGGYESVAVPETIGGLTVLDPHDDHVFGQVDLAYYPIDDLKVYGGYRYVNEASLGAAGIEYLMRADDSPISIFAKADFGEEQYNRITGGVKFYLGPNADKVADGAPPHRGPGELHADVRTPFQNRRTPVHGQQRHDGNEPGQRPVRLPARHVPARFPADAGHHRGLCLFQQQLACRVRLQRRSPLASHRSRKAE